MTKKLFQINVSYGQFVVVAESKEEAYKLYHPSDEKEAHFYAYYDVEMKNIHEIEGYKVEGETAIVGGYAE